MDANDKNRLKSEALCYAYGREDADGHSRRPIVAPHKFADRIVVEGKGWVDFRTVYNAMLDEGA